MRFLMQPYVVYVAHYASRRDATIGSKTNTLQPSFRISERCDLK